MGPLAIGLAAAGGVMNVASSLFGANQKRQQLRYEAQLADRNAALARQNARDVEAAGRVAEQSKRMETAQQLGSYRAGAGASGFDVGAGSALSTQSDVAMVGEHEAKTVRHNYQREANQHYQQAWNFAAEAAAARAGSKNAVTGGILGAVGTLLGTGSQLAGSWYKYKKALLEVPKTTSIS